MEVGVYAIAMHARPAAAVLHQPGVPAVLQEPGVQADLLLALHVASSAVRTGQRAIEMFITGHLIGAVVPPVIEAAIDHVYCHIL